MLSILYICIHFYVLSRILTVSSIGILLWWFPLIFRGPTDELGKQWAREGWKYFNSIRQSEGAKETGIVEVRLIIRLKLSFSGVRSHYYTLFQIPLYVLSSTSSAAQKDTFLAANSRISRTCHRRELDLFQPPGKWKSGTYAHTLVIDCTYYLPWLTRKFKEGGGYIKEKRVDKLEDLEGE